jgi:translation initiation factor IF-1
MIETSGVIEKEQGNGFYLVTLEQPAGHQCLCRAAGKLTKFRIKLLAGDKVLVEISPTTSPGAGSPIGSAMPVPPGHGQPATGPAGLGAAEPAGSRSREPRGGKRMAAWQRLTWGCLLRPGR